MYEKFAELLAKKHITAYRIAKDTRIPPSTFSDWKKGKSKPKQEKMKKITDYLNVPSDYFSADYSNKKAPALTEKDERDIAKNLDKIMDQLEHSGDLMFDGDPMSDEARESIKAAMKLGLEAAKAKNKARFTPKKYRKE